MKYVYDYIPGVSMHDFPRRAGDLDEAGWEVISVTTDDSHPVVSRALTLFVRREAENEGGER